MTSLNIATDGNTRVIHKSFGKSVTSIRRLLMNAGLSVVGEFNIASEQYIRLGPAKRSCTILIVDTPALLFECIALDRAAAVFLPVHIVVSGDCETTYVHWANPVENSGLRAPMPAKLPLENLCSRITQAFAALPQYAAESFPEQSQEIRDLSNGGSYVRHVG